MKLVSELHPVPMQVLVQDQVETAVRVLEGLLFFKLILKHPRHSVNLDQSWWLGCLRASKSIHWSLKILNWNLVVVDLSSKSTFLGSVRWKTTLRLTCRAKFRSWLVRISWLLQWIIPEPRKLVLCVSSRPLPLVHVVRGRCPRGHQRRLMFRREDMASLLPENITYKDCVRDHEVCPFVSKNFSLSGCLILNAAPRHRPLS